jgi:ankyrin repeat protein
MRQHRIAENLRTFRLPRTWVVAGAILFACASILHVAPAVSQTPPNRTEIFHYKGLLASTIRANVAETEQLLKNGVDPNQRDEHGRTPLLVAAHRGDLQLARVLVKGGADPRAVDSQRYDAITIAAVRNDVPFLRLAIELGGNPKAITSPYDGTALIAAAHLGHDSIVEALIKAGAPLDHVNNLGWTALIEAIVLGNGGRTHRNCVKALLAAGANPNIADRNGASPLKLARDRGFVEMADMISAAGGK